MTGNNRAFGWPDFWAMFRDSQDVMAIAQALNSGRDNDGQMAGFRQWLKTRSDKVQAEVMGQAPLDVLLSFSTVLSQRALAEIAKERSREDAYILSTLKRH